MSASARPGALNQLPSGTSQLVPDTYILICSEHASLSFAPGVSQRLVGYYQLPAGQLLPPGFMSDPLDIFPKCFSRLSVGMFRSDDFLRLGHRSWLQTGFSVLV